LIRSGHLHSSLNQNCSRALYAPTSGIAPCQRHAPSTLIFTKLYPRDTGEKTPPATLLPIDNRTLKDAKECKRTGLMQVKSGDRTKSVAVPLGKA
jgi:hypothetical protein